MNIGSLLVADAQSAKLVAPEGSLTVPTILPVPTVVWANDGAVRLNSPRISVKTSEQARAAFLPWTIMREQL